MLKLVVKFSKIITLLMILMILNPHRALLIPLQILCCFGSWLAWRVEDLCKWVGKMIEKAQVKFWLFGKSLSETSKKELREIDEFLKGGGNV